MSYIVLRSINDLCAQTRKSLLSEAVQRAEELIKEGIERNLIICEETDNSEAKKIDWTQPTWKRKFICNVS